MRTSEGRRWLERPRWWGGRSHKIFTLFVFVVLSSLDNTATGIFPPLYGLIARDLMVDEAALGLITAARILMASVSAAFWGFQGDRSDRKRLLLYGSLVWSLAILFSGLSTSFGQLLISQLIAAVGLGAVGSVGFSLVSDFIPPQRRGLILSLWGMAQSIGWGTGFALSSTIGVYNWHAPFWLIASSGVVFLFLYIFSYEPERGQTEPELADLFAAGQSYTYRAHRDDIRRLLRQGSNIWLILAGFAGAFGGGILLWMPRLFTAKLQAEGLSLEAATISGSLLALVFQSGSYFAIPAGYLGDLWQRRSLRGRALFSMMGIVATVPFHIAFFLMPLPGLNIPEQEGMIAIALTTLTAIFSNGPVALAFFIAVVASVLIAIDGPNRAALINDVNLPEHRGTVVGLSFLIGGTGAALSNFLIGLSFAFLTRYMAEPWNYAIGMSFFILLLLPAGWCYHRVSRTSPTDILTVRRILAERARLQNQPPPVDTQANPLP